jgi:3-hydroxybutyryl-CoA dehydrogenase
VARPFYGEALRLLEEGAADAETIDLVLTECAGFRMGPFALMDLIGHDVNAAVTRSLFEAFGSDPRYRPSLFQQELIAAGRLGRKSGRGVYEYGDTAGKPSGARLARTPGGSCGLVPDGRADAVDGALLVRTDGRTAVERARSDGRPVILYDLVDDAASPRRLAVTASPDVPAAALETLRRRLSRDGIAVSELADRPGMVAMRTVVMLANEAFEAALTGVASEAAIDAAMVLGVNYPRGPFAWARHIGARTVLEILSAIHAATGDPRYRPSLGLRLEADREALAQIGGHAP